MGKTAGVPEFCRFAPTPLLIHRQNLAAFRGSNITSASPLWEGETKEKGGVNWAQQFPKSLGRRRRFPAHRPWHPSSPTRKRPTPTPIPELYPPQHKPNLLSPQQEEKKPNNLANKMAQKTTLEEFEAVFPKLEAVLLEHANSYKLPAQAVEWYKNVSWQCPQEPAQETERERTKERTTKKNGLLTQPLSSL